MVIWIILTLLLAHNQPSSATTFSIPQNAKVYIKESELHLWNTLSFAFKTLSSGILLQQPEFINFQDFVQLVLTDTGHFQLKWRYKGQSGILGLTSGQINLADGSWHVISFAYQDYNLTLKIDNFIVENITSLAKTPSLFSVRVSQQDSRVVVGQSVGGDLCFQTGPLLGHRKFWIAEGNVLMSHGSVDNCQSGNLRSADFGLTDLGSCPGESGQTCNDEQKCYFLANIENCACPENTGSNCDESIQPCDRHYCENEGECKSVDNIPFCDCKDNYSGDFCEIHSSGCEGNEFGYAIDELNMCYNKSGCYPNSCKNKGTCEESESSLLQYTCDCPTGFSGHDCEINSDDCQSDSCSGNGICVDMRNDFVCYCNAGWKEAECSEQFDVCTFFDPCLNGNCINILIGSEADGTDQPYFQCECDEGWTGRQCEENVNECALLAPCENGATCSDNDGSYKCACSQDWTGKDCTENVDRCLDNVDCGEFGICQDEEVGISCLCDDTHSGEFCLESICSPDHNPCQNGAECILEDDNYSCNCTEYFEGEHCAEWKSLCTGPLVPTLTEQGYDCVCPEGFEGDNCDSIENCDSKCIHGTCETTDGTTTCDCDSSAGYEGVLCDENIDNCHPDPCNGGTCEDKVNSFKCTTCPIGFTGSECDKNIDECSGSPCENFGTCQDLEGDYNCTCLEGYSGKNCEVNINECDPDLCLNGGACHNLIGRYECDCSGTGYTGSNCQNEIDECAGQPCQNGGTCTVEINSFTCDCSETGFEGDLCEVNIDECVREEVICYHGGECRDEVKGFECDCNEGFSGTYCEHDFPDCQANPCKNGGTCLEVSRTLNYPRIKPLIDNQDFDYKNAAGFACECAEGFEGSTCEGIINYCVLETNCVSEQTSDCVNKSPSEGYYSCECNDGFEGDFCQTNINDCEESPCQNNAICIDGDNDYSCQCTGLFAGKNCSIAMTGCDRDDCQNGGKCQPTFVNNEHGHLCECTPGYTGDRCQSFTDLNLASPFAYSTSQQYQNLDLSLRIQTTLSSMTLVSSEFFRLAVDVTGNLEFTVFGFSIKSEEAISHGEWVDVVVKYENLEATLRYKDKNCVDWCESSSDISERESFSFDQITIGSDVDQNEVSKFVGCVEDFKVNTDLLLGGENGVPTSTSQCVRVKQCGQLSCNAHGTCVDLWTTFECQCFDMYAGQFCGQDLEEIFEISTGNFNFENNCGAVGSWAEYALEGSNHLMALSFHVRTVEDSGVIYQHGQLGKFEIMVKLVDSKLDLRLGDEDHPTDVVISDGEPHKIVLNYGTDSEDNEFRLIVDESLNSSFQRPKNAFDIDLLDSIAFGEFGIFFNQQKVNLENLGLSEFKGCISDVRATVIDLDNVITYLSLRFSTNDVEIGGHEAVDFTTINCIEAGCKSDDTCQSEPCLNDGTCTVTWNDYTCNCSEGYAGHNCEDVDYCNSNTCHEGDFCMNVDGGFECHDAISFDKTSSYVRASASDAIKSDSFSTIQLTLRTRASESFLFFIEGTGGCYVSAQLKAGNISIHFKFDQQSNAETVEVDKNLADGHSNVVHLEFFTDKIIVKVNDVEILSKTVSLSQLPTIECVASQRIFIGGLNEQDIIQSVTSKIPNSPPYFDGCISNFRINNMFVPLYTSASSFSLNVYNFETSTGTTPGCSSGNSCSEDNCNLGTCRELWRNFECDCHSGFEGDECDVNIDDCVDHKCENGSPCLDGINKYTCHCAEGYKGQYCEEDVDECEDLNFCSNGGVCENSVGSFSCDCPPEWTGDKCDVMTINTLLCAYDNPCNSNGGCTDAFGSEPQFWCSCFPGFEGVQCERELDLCAGHPCKNAHNCTTKIDNQAKSATYVCVCIDGFSGKNCTDQEVAKTCEGQDCNGNGHCEVLSNEPICRCNSGFRGVKCQEDINECKEGEYPCVENNTTECLNTAGSYECRCVIGWAGEDCSKEKHKPETSKFSILNNRQNLRESNKVYAKNVELPNQKVVIRPSTLQNIGDPV